MPMQPNDKVFVKSLKAEGTILELRPNGLYLVAIGIMKVERPEKDLKPIVSGSEKAKKTYSTPALKTDVLSRRSAEAPLDLHGMRVEEALKLLADKIDAAIQSDVDKVAVIHGLGTGALLHAVHEFLKKEPVVKNFKLEQGNPGTTWIYF